MLLGLSGGKSNKILCGILVMLILLTGIPHYDFSARFVEISTSDAPLNTSIEDASDSATDIAFVEESSISCRNECNVRLGKKRSNGYERTIREHLIGLLTAVQALASLTLLLFVFVEAAVSQRFSIITYIHNMDGQKSDPLSCIC